MNRLLIILLLTVLPVYILKGQDQYYFRGGLRLGAGVSTLHGLRQASIPSIAGGDVSAGYAFSWDVALVTQLGLGNNTFYQVEGGYSVQMSTIEGAVDSEYKDMQTKYFDASNCFVMVSLGKKKHLGKDTRVFVSAGLYGSMFYSFYDEPRRKILRVEDVKFKDFDFGAVAACGIEYKGLQFSVNPQFGLLNLAHSGPKVRTRAIKFATAYLF